MVNGVVITMLKLETSIFGDVKQYYSNFGNTTKLTLIIYNAAMLCIEKIIILDLCYVTVSENITDS